MKQGNLTHKFNKSEKLAFITLQMSVFSYGIFDYYCNAIENPCIFIVGCVCVLVVKTDLIYNWYSDYILSYDYSMANTQKI